MLAPEATERPRVLAASISSYNELHAVLRARAEELKVTRLSLDHVSGLQPGYVSKLLAPTKMRKLGPVSLGPLLAVMGVRLIAVEDESAAVFLKRLEPRKNASAGMRTPRRHPPQNYQFAGNSAWGKHLASLRWLNVSPKRRSSLARHAARIRWAARGTRQ